MNIDNYWQLLKTYMLNKLELIHLILDPLQMQLQLYTMTREGNEHVTDVYIDS